MLIRALIVTAYSLILTSFADVTEEWKTSSQELTEISAKYSAKERELRAAGEGSTELEEKARQAFSEFLQAMEKHPKLESYGKEQKELESEIAAAIKANDDQNRESALFALQKLKGEQMKAALEIPELQKLKESAEAAHLEAQQALVKSDPEAQALLKKRQELLKRLAEISAKMNASE